MSDVLSYVFFFVFIFEELVHDMNNPMLQKPRKDCICIRKKTVDSELSISTALSTVLGFLALYMFTSIYIHTHTNPDIYMIPVWDRGRHQHAYTYTDPYTYTYKQGFLLLWYSTKNPLKVNLIRMTTNSLVGYG